MGTYSDGSKTAVTVTADNISGFNSSAPATRQTVTVTIDGKTATFTVTIVANDTTALGVYYRIHVQNVGWQKQKGDGEVSGTFGKSLRLEAIQIIGWDYENQEEFDIYYRTHIQNIGWEQEWKHNKDISGTSGLGLRLEAIEIMLPDTVRDYNIYYRVHAQNFGWLDWAVNGQSAGTEGFAYRLEGIQIMMVAEGAPAPGSTDQPFIKK